MLPSDLNSELKTDTMIVGAFLSDLVASKKIKISNAKIGGSPVYYLESQRSKLERLYQYLNEKDRRAYDDLKKEGVLYDEEQSPLVKTCLRQIKDFAFPLKVTFKEKEHLFWKWHLLSDEDAKIKIKDLLSKLYPEQKKTPSNIEPVKVQTKVQESPTEKKKISVTASPTKPEEKKLASEIIIQKPVQQTLQGLPDDAFLEDVKRYLETLQIKIINAEIVKKKSECNLFVIVPSHIGELQYYCKAKKKKRSNEGDIAAAFVEGQLRGLPVIYVSPGDIPKKLKEQLDKKYKNLRVLTWVSQ